MQMVFLNLELCKTRSKHFGISSFLHLKTFFYVQLQFTLRFCSAFLQAVQCVGLKFYCFQDISRRTT